MRADRPIRIPLQLGTSALHSLARASAFFVPGIILTGVAAAILLLVADVLGDLGDLGGYIGALIATPGLALLTFAWKHARRARDARPSDLVIDAHGFTVSSGPHDGRHVAWSDIARVQIERPPKPRKNTSDEDDSDLGQLCVYVKKAGEGKEERLLLAAADRAIEQRSLKQLARTLRADLRVQRDPVKRAADGKDAVALLSCAGCGAVLAPSSESSVTCAHCAKVTAVPTDMRERLRDADTVLARPDAVIAKLLDQPGARVVGRMFALAAVFMLTAWPAALVLLARNYRERALTVQTTGFVFLFLVACICGFFALTRGRLVDRQALRLVMLDFAAHAPSAPGEPFTCRSCIAPLPDRGEHVLVSCIYCRADNVLGIDLRREASAVRSEARSLEKALALRASERRRWRGVTAASLVVIALAAYSFRHGIGHNPKTWPLEQRCDGGDIEACVDLADLIGLARSREVRSDTKRAAKLYERACDQGNARACESAGNLFADWLLAPNGRRDGKRAVELRSRACEQKRGTACRALAEQYQNGDLFSGVRKDPAKAAALFQEACALGDAEACTGPAEAKQGPVPR